MKQEQAGIPIRTSEEIANVLTHAVGVVLFLAGATALVIKAHLNDDSWQVLSAYIFGGSLVLLYAASTLYHAISDDRWKPAFHLVDHAAIYLLIAGTYTPFLLVALRDEVHISFILVMWGIAISGIVYKLFFLNKYRLVSTLIYLAMGWMAVLKINTFYTHLPIQASMWILAGGLFYSVGTIFYSKKSMQYHHAIWHVFVLCGSACHFIAIYLFVY